MKAIKISRPELGNGGYILSKEELNTVIGEIESMFECDEPGDRLEIKLIEISKERFDNLEEFTGW